MQTSDFPEMTWLKICPISELKLFTAVFIKLLPDNLRSVFVHFNLVAGFEMPVYEGLWSLWFCPLCNPIRAFCVPDQIGVIGSRGGGWEWSECSRLGSLWSQDGPESRLGSRGVWGGVGRSRIGSLNPSVVQGQGYRVQGRYTVHIAYLYGL